MTNYIEGEFDPQSNQQCNDDLDRSSVEKFYEGLAPNDDSVYIPASYEHMFDLDGDADAGFNGENAPSYLTARPAVRADGDILLSPEANIAISLIRRLRGAATWAICKSAGADEPCDVPTLDALTHAILAEIAAPLQRLELFERLIVSGKILDLSPHPAFDYLFEALRDAVDAYALNMPPATFAQVDLLDRHLNDVGICWSDGQTTVIDIVDPTHPCGCTTDHKAGLGRVHRHMEARLDSPDASIWSRKVVFRWLPTGFPSEALFVGVAPGTVVHEPAAMESFLDDPEAA